MEYWAVVWGTIIMGVTGLVIWFKMDVTKFLPRWAVDVPLTIHYYEAILACLAIVVWHFYHVIFDPDVYPLNWACWNGKVSKHWQEEEHPLDGTTEAKCELLKHQRQQRPGRHQGGRRGQRFNGAACTPSARKKKGGPALHRTAPNPTMKRGGRRLLVPAPPHSGGCRQGTYTRLNRRKRATQDTGETRSRNCIGAARVARVIAQPQGNTYANRTVGCLLLDGNCAGSSPAHL